MKMQERIANLEGKVDILNSGQDEMKTELRQFRHDLFDLVNPLVSRLASAETSIQWIEKTKRWGPFLKIGSATGLTALLVEALRLLGR